MNDDQVPEAADAARRPADRRADGGSRFLRPGAAVRVAAGLARRPHRAARRVGHLGAELTRVAGGRSDLRPGKRDRRFADPAWESSWLFRRLLQTHLAVEETVDGLISDSGVDWRAERQARFAAGNVLDALAPTNFPWSNPAVLKASVDQGGANLVRGARHFARDFPRLPATVDTSEVRGRREPRAHARHGRAAHRGLRADPVRAADRAGARGPAAVRAADDQQVLRARPRAGPQPGRVARAAGPAGVRDLVAQPGRRAGPLRPRHLRARRARGARRGRAHHRPARRSTSTAPARAGSSAPARSAISPPRAGSARSPA